MPPEIQDIAESFELSSSAAIGIPLALTAAVLLAFGTQYQNRGVVYVDTASDTSGKTGLSLRQLRALLARPSWVIGSVLLGIGMVVQLASLGFAPLIVVQPLGAVALVITAILNARYSKIPLDAISIRAIIVCVLGVAGFVTIAALFAKSNAITETQLIVVLSVLVAVLAVLITLFILMRKHRPRPIFYVVAGGVLFGFVVTLAKVVIDRVRTIMSGTFEISAADILTLLCLLGIAAAALLGMYFVQTAHSSNPPDIVVAGLTVIDPLVAVSIGVIVLGEAADAPLWAIFAMAAAAAVAIWGVLSLARHHPQSLANVTLAAAAPR